MMSKIYPLSIVSLTVLLTGCMSGWNMGAKDTSSLNSYLDEHAAKIKPMSAKPKGLENQPPEKNVLMESESSDDSYAKKLAARLEAAKGESAETPESTDYAARVNALSLPEADKKQILDQFSSATDSQWQELLSKLEPVFGPKESAPAKTQIAQQPAGKTDMVSQYASKLVDRHLTAKSPTADEDESPQRLPSINMHQDKSHLAQANPALYPKTIDLERGKSPEAANPSQGPQQHMRRDTNVQLATYVPEMDETREGLYPEDLQAEEFRRMQHDPKYLPNKKAGPKPNPGVEETVDDLSDQEYRVMQVLWDRGQVSLESLHKEYRLNYGPDTETTSPDPSMVSLDELHAILFDLKGRGWIDDSRRGNTVAYWSIREQPDSAGGNWEKSLADTIKKLESLAGNSRSTQEERTIAQLRLRMLYLIADRKSEAMERVDGLTPEEQEVWTHTLFGLADYMKLDDIPVNRRHALALGSFRRAMANLEAASPLELRNLEFIQSVESFGQFKPFTTHDFRPKQEVLLYVEVDNFSSQESGGSFQTVLQSNYEIYDKSGRRIDARQFPEVKDHCRVRRRDFYVPYRIYMPEEIAPGEYRLELTVRDPVADKFGQASIEFHIK
ncbi:hypothetical protein GC197_06825 [bacterium]|nr:hypothetical protein [bacterium]